MKLPALLSLLLVSTALTAADLQTIKFTCDDWTEGDPPKDVFVVDGTIKVAARDGNKALVIEPTPITEGIAQIGSSAAGSATVQARVFASSRGRSHPRFGVGVHGMVGHRLIVNVARKSLDLVKGDQVLASTPFLWKTETWVHLKLAVTKSGEDWTITGKAWMEGDQVPQEPQIQHADKGLKGQGKTSLIGTPYSEKPIWFDDIEVSIEAPAEAK